MFKHPFCGNEPEKSMEKKRFFGDPSCTTSWASFWAASKVSCPKWQPPRLQGQPTHVANDEDIQDIHFSNVYIFSTWKKTQSSLDFVVCNLCPISLHALRNIALMTRMTWYNNWNMLTSILLKGEGFKIQTAYCWHFYCFQRWMVPTIAVGVW